jgi:hypothetical protein
MLRRSAKCVKGAGEPAPYSGRAAFEVIADAVRIGCHRARYTWLVHMSVTAHPSADWSLQQLS